MLARTLPCRVMATATTGPAAIRPPGGGGFLSVVFPRAPRGISVGRPCDGSDRPALRSPSAGRVPAGFPDSRSRSREQRSRRRDSSCRRSISGRRKPRSPAGGEHRLCLQRPHLRPLLPRPLDASFGAQRRQRSQASPAGRPGLARYLRTMRDRHSSRLNRKLRRRQQRQSKMLVSSRVVS